MKRKTFFIAVLALGLAACSQSDLQLETPETPVSEISKEAVEPGSTKVSLNLAEKAALSTRPGTRAGSDIQDIRTVFTDDGEPAFHAVNFANSNGYVLVSASQNYTPILAEVESGTFDLINLPDNVRFYLEDYKHAIKVCNKAPEDSVKNYRLLWKKYLAEETTEQKPVTRSSDPYLDAFIFDSQRNWSSGGYRWTSLAQDQLGLDFFGNVVMDLTDSNPDVDLSTCFIVIKPIPTKIERYLSPPTMWGPGRPFNNDIETNNIENIYPAGCYTVAIAQVMKYLRKPSYFNWDAMEDVISPFSTAPVVSAMFADIYKKAKVTQIYNTTTNKYEGVTTIANACAALKSYGFTQAKVIEHNFSSVVENVNNGYPVIGEGRPNSTSSGHAWIYDGVTSVLNYCYYYLFVPQEDSSSYFQYRWDETELDGSVVDIFYSEQTVHINWGDCGLHNGFFHNSNIYYNDESKNTTTGFNYNKQDIINIK